MAPERKSGFLTQFFGNVLRDIALRDPEGNRQFRKQQGLGAFHVGLVHAADFLIVLKTAVFFRIDGYQQRNEILVVVRAHQFAVTVIQLLHIGRVA